MSEKQTKQRDLTALAVMYPSRITDIVDQCSDFIREAEMDLKGAVRPDRIIETAFEAGYPLPIIKMALKSLGYDVSLDRDGIIVNASPMLPGHSGWFDFKAPKDPAQSEESKPSTFAPLTSTDFYKRSAQEPFVDRLLFGDLDQEEKAIFMSDLASPPKAPKK